MYLKFWPVEFLSFCRSKTCSVVVPLPTWWCRCRRSPVGYCCWPVTVRGFAEIISLLAQTVPAPRPAELWSPRQGPQWTAPPAGDRPETTPSEFETSLHRRTDPNRPAGADKQTIKSMWKNNSFILIEKVGLYAMTISNWPSAGPALPCESCSSRSEFWRMLVHPIRTSWPDRGPADGQLSIRWGNGGFNIWEKKNLDIDVGGTWVSDLCLYLMVTQGVWLTIRAGAAPS